MGLVSSEAGDTVHDIQLSNWLPSPKDGCVSEPVLSHPWKLGEFSNELSACQRVPGCFPPACRLSSVLGSVLHLQRVCAEVQ